MACTTFEAAGEDPVVNIEICNNCMERFGNYLAGIYDAADMSLNYEDGDFVFRGSLDNLDNNCSDPVELFVRLYREFIINLNGNWNTCLNKRCQAPLPF